MSRNWIDRCRAARCAALLLAVLLAGCAGAPVQTSAGGTGEAGATAWPADAVSRYERALGLMDEGRDADATQAMQALAARYPEAAGPLMNLGLLAARGDDPEAAMKYFQLALAVCTHCAPAWNQVGILHRRDGRFAEAEQAYLQALDSDPDYALAHYNLGVLYDLYQGRHAEAVEHYESYVALAVPGQDTAEVDRWIADLRRRLGENARTADAGELR